MKIRKKHIIINGIVISIYCMIRMLIAYVSGIPINIFNMLLIIVFIICCVSYSLVYFIEPIMFSFKKGCSHRDDKKVMLYSRMAKIPLRYSTFLQLNEVKELLLKKEKNTIFNCQIIDSGENLKLLIKNRFMESLQLMEIEFDIFLEEKEGSTNIYVKIPDHIKRPLYSYYRWYQIDLFIMDKVNAVCI